MSGTSRTPAAPARADDGFSRAAEPFRRELLAHCYRLVGSVDDAEELVQETYLRAWRAYDGFERRSSLRVWLYRIATNVCLSALQRSPRRVLPSGLGAPGDDPAVEPELAAADTPWLQPVPDTLVVSGSGPSAEDPAVIVGGRESVRLALIASLQHLPPRQRAVFILRDVLAFSASEVAGMLGSSAPAVKSALQRARAQIALADPQPETVEEPSAAEARAWLDRYMTAFERADPEMLEAALRHDAMLEMTPARTWFAGKRTCMPYLRSVIGVSGDWRAIPIEVNGGVGAATYHRTTDGGSGRHASFAIVALGVAPDGIHRITLFSEPALFDRFGVPRELPASG